MQHFSANVYPRGGVDQANKPSSDGSRGIRPLEPWISLTDSIPPLTKSICGRMLVNRLCGPFQCTRVNLRRKLGLVCRYTNPLPLCWPDKHFPHEAGLSQLEDDLRMGALRCVVPCSFESRPRFPFPFAVPAPLTRRPHEMRGSTIAGPPWVDHVTACLASTM